MGLSRIYSMLQCLKILAWKKTVNERTQLKLDKISIVWASFYLTHIILELCHPMKLMGERVGTKGSVCSYIA